ncbi:MAG: cobalamin biosynthesis protein CbiD [Prevotella sp.]|nr:cobalamin biosynthesis protein CbiD [Prevotella sp.]
MILVFGGTTEGRAAISELEEAGQHYYYSTKTGEQDVTLHNGQLLSGAMTQEAMREFCTANAIRLIVDAAHPFAAHLHQTVVTVAAELGLPVIRYERQYPERAEDIRWIDDYAELAALSESSESSENSENSETSERSESSEPSETSENSEPSKLLLATTGVQSIGRLKPLEAQGLRIVYRILPRESSIRLAHQQGADDSQLCFYQEGEDEEEVMRRLKPAFILLKESGRSGGFTEKVEAARRLGIRIIALKRPSIISPSSSTLHHPSVTFHQVDGPFGLRRMIERLLPDFYPLHSGLTTGTCATAAAIAAARQALLGEQPPTVGVVLPNGETIPVEVHYAEGYAYVIKDSGDDPDVTKGIEIRAVVERKGGAGTPIEIVAGQGIGTITLPGFDYPPGEPAINRVPRQMLRQNLQPFGRPLRITLSVPEGEEIARRTFNPRLGITGGISIIGVSGIIKPFSEESFIQSIHKCLEVARATGTGHVVINSGAKSERYVKQHVTGLPPQCFVEYGNYIGETIRMAAELGIGHVTLGVMIGKAVKLAAGHLDTHSRRTVMDRAFIGQMLDECGADEGTKKRAEGITLARELWDFAPEAFFQVVKHHCYEHCRPLLPDGQLTLFLIDEQGGIH